MKRFDVSLDIALICCLTVTLVPRILYTFMNNLLVAIKNVLSWSLIVTLVSRIFQTLINRFLVGLKMALLCGLMTTEYFTPS